MVEIAGIESIENKVKLVGIIAKMNVEHVKLKVSS